MGSGQPEVVEELTRRGFTDITVIGRGGHAVVYRAEQPAFGRTVAVKVLTDSDLDPVAFERFERERRALGSMSNHPNILTVYEGGVTRTGQAFLVTEYAPRGTLGERVARRGPVPWPEVVATGIKLAGALETAHRRGVVHRDVKPENVLLSDYGEPLLGDFGIARITGGFVTSTTIIRASVAHVPPEVLEGERPRPSTDVYSLASTILTVIWGRPPFFAEDEPVATLSDRIAREAPPDLRTRGVPGAVCRVLERGLAKRPSDRPPSALALGEELCAAQRAMGQAVTPLPLVAGDADEQPFTGAGDLTPAPALRGAPAPPTVGARHDAARRRRRARLLRAGAVAGVLAVAGAVAGAALVLRDGGGEAVAVPADGLAVAGNRLWVVGGEGDDGRLVAFGLPDGRPSEGAPEEPTGVVAVASDGRSTWALNEAGVHRLALGGPGLRQEIDGRPVAVEVAVDRVWVLDVVGDKLVLGSFAVDGGPEVLQETVGPAGEDGAQAWRGALAVEDGEVWVTDGRRILARRLPNQRELERVRVNGDVVDLAIDGRFVWAGTRDGRLLRIDRVSRDVIEVLVGRLPVTEVVAEGGSVWTADEEGRVRRVAGDIPEARTALTVDAGRKVLALGGAGTVLYVANAETGVVDQVDGRSGEIDADGRIDLTNALG
jgi:hypothetical protein